MTWIVLLFAIISVNGWVLDVTNSIENPTINLSDRFRGLQCLVRTDSSFRKDACRFFAHVAHFRLAYRCCLIEHVLSDSFFGLFCSIHFSRQFGDVNLSSTLSRRLQKRASEGFPDLDTVDDINLFSALSVLSWHAQAILIARVLNSDFRPLRQTDHGRSITVAVLSSMPFSHPHYKIQEFLVRNLRNHVNLICLSFRSNESLSSLCPQKLTLDPQGISRSASLVSSLQLSVLLDVDSLTLTEHRLLLSQRVSYLQIGGMGFLGPSSMHIHDYFLTDKISLPPEFASQQSGIAKSLVFPYNIVSLVEWIHASRSGNKGGLNDSEFRVGFINQPFKFSLEDFNILSALLARCHRSAVTFKSFPTMHPMLPENVGKAFDAVLPGSLSRITWTPFSKTLTCTQLASSSVVFDPTGFSGHSTFGNL